jgi:hypothetical protein
MDWSALTGGRNRLCAAQDVKFLAGQQLIRQAAGQVS